MLIAVKLKPLPTVSFTSIWDCAIFFSGRYLYCNQSQTKKYSNMKKQFLATLVLVISVFATATATDKKREATSSTSKTITVKQGFSKLVADGNVEVVLYEDNNISEIRSFGTNADVAATSITEKNGVVTITNKNKKGQKVLVYVPVNNLEVIEAKGFSKVSSAAPLSSAQLTLVVTGECYFNIQATGNIDVLQEVEGDVMIERKNTEAV